MWACAQRLVSYLKFYLYLGYLIIGMLLSFYCQKKKKMVCCVISGINVVNKGCCGMGSIAVAIPCSRKIPFTCTNDSKYVFFYL